MAMRQLKIFEVLFLCFSVLLVACGPVSRSNVKAALDEVESYINDRPDSALAVLRGLDSTAVIRRPAQRARAALLHSMALDKCYIDLQTDSILAPAVAWYRRHGTPDERLMTHYYLGRLQYNAGDYQEAIVTYTEALALTDRATDHKYIGLVNQAIADTYGVTNLEMEALPFLREAFKCFEENKDSILALSTQYKIALTLGTENRNREADSLFRALLNSNLPDNLRLRVLSDYGLFFASHTNEFEEALHVFDQTLEEYGALLRLDHWAAYAFVLTVAGRVNESSQVFSLMEKQFGDDPILVYWEGRAAEIQKDYKTAYLNLSHSLPAQDSIVRASLRQSAVLAQKEYYKSRTQIAESRLESHRLRVLWLVTVLLLFLAGLFFFLTLRIKDYKSQAMSYLQLMETMDRRTSELQSKQEQLFQAYLYVYGQLSEEYERTKDNGRLDSVSFRRLKRTIANLKGEGKGTFERLIDLHMNNLMSDFRSEFEAIMKEEDIILVSYLFSGFDTATASTLLGISPEAFYMRKSRIKKVLKERGGGQVDRYLHFFEKRK